jgi:S1-C subfamily serine protease
MTGKLWSALLIAAALLCGWPARAALIPQSNFTYNKWNGGGYTDDQSGKFSHCAVSSTYQNGLTLTFAVNPNGSVTIGFFHPGWTLKVGEEIAGDIRIDQRYSVHAVGIAILPTAVKVVFLATDPIFGHLQHGYVMSVTTATGSASYSLTDSFRALEIARRCVATYQAKLGTATAQNNPEAQKWFARNPWFSYPQYGDQARAATAIDSQMTLEGKNPTTAAYWAELDERLRKAGVVVPQVPTQPSAGTSLPPAPPRPSPKTGEESGSGFVVSTAGHVVTNNHVIGDCVDKVHGNLPGESAIELRVVSTDQANDLALLIAPAPLKDAATIRGVAIHPGDGVVAIGYPFYGLLSTEFSVTTGIVSSLGGIGNDSRYLQISAAVQPGNSGGPLIDTSGNVVGVVSEKIDAIRVAKITGTIPENVNFSIKTGALRDFLDKNAVAYATAAPAAEVKTADIAARARSYVMRIWCTVRADE